MSNQVEIAMEEIIPKDNFDCLQAEELKIGAKLSPGQYAELIIGFLLRGQHIQAKFCSIRALQRYGNDNVMKQIWELVMDISKMKMTNAIIECDKAMSMVADDQCLRTYIEELKKQLLVEQLQIIATTYSSIGLPMFRQLIGLPSDDELKSLLEQFNWEISDNYIAPTWNVYFEKTLADLNPKYKYSKIDDKAKSEAPATNKNLENLNSLVDCSIFFDAVSTMIPNTNSGGAGNNPSN